MESCLLSTYHTVAYSRTLYVKCERASTAALIKWCKHPRKDDALGTKYIAICDVLAFHHLEAPTKVLFSDIYNHNLIKVLGESMHEMSM